jgi:ADP-ribose pyrophosphatase YjhB (NUDIX family)
MGTLRRLLKEHGLGEAKHSRTEYLNDPEAPKPDSLLPAAGVLAAGVLAAGVLAAGPGQWAIPMGKQEIGETVTQCAERETREETGVTVKVTGLLGIFSGPGHVPAAAPPPHSD